MGYTHIILLEKLKNFPEEISTKGGIILIFAKSLDLDILNVNLDFIIMFDILEHMFPSDSILVFDVLYKLMNEESKIILCTPISQLPTNETCLVNQKHK